MRATAGRAREDVYHDAEGFPASSVTHGANPLHTGERAARAAVIPSRRRGPPHWHGRCNPVQAALSDDSMNAR
jgi:hypothetical protein